MDAGSLQSVLFVFTTVHLAYRFLFVAHSKANWQHCNNCIYWRRLIQGVLAFKHQVPRLESWIAESLGLLAIIVLNRTLVQYMMITDEVSQVCV